MNELRGGAQLLSLKPFTLVCGHYGCGKTNLSLNLAVDLAKSGKQVSLVDLDIVNPYFRSSDYRRVAEGAGVRVIAPGYAGSTLDSPALPAEIFSVFESPGHVIFDVGGDDVGATALGRFAPKIQKIDYELLYVVNKYRPNTAEAAGAEELLREIEAASRLKATGVVNNSHLMVFTEAETIRASLPYAEQTARELGLPLRFTTAPENVAAALGDVENLYPVKIYVKTPWME